MSTSFTEQEHEAARAHRDGEARAYSNDTSKRTLGQLVADATQDVSSIIRNEIQLAKAEVKTDVTKAGKGIGMFVGAGVMGFLGLIFLLHFIARGIAVFLNVWAGYLIVALLLFLVAGILAMIGKKSVSNVNVKPERTIRNAQETVQAFKPASPTATRPGTATGPRAVQHGVAADRTQPISTTGVPAQDGAHRVS